MIRRTYIDTNILKFSATELPRLQPRDQTVNWGGRLHEVTVHDFVLVNPNNQIQNPELCHEAAFLPVLAEMGKSGTVHFVMQVETEFESWGLPNMDSRTGRFYGAPIEFVEAPVRYGRIMFGLNLDPKEEQFDFLASITDERFLELQRMTGAYQGPGKLNRNQLLDAWHIWCAEYSHCRYFLTMDLKLKRVLTKSKARLAVGVVLPSELLAELEGGT